MPSHGARTQDLAFLSGFIAGDGSFSIRENNAGASWCCALQVNLRADDTPLLSGFREWTGLGELFPARARGGSAPQTAWVVARRDDCVELVELLDESPPLGKAAAVYELWRSAVAIWSADGGTASALARLAGELSALRRARRPSRAPVHITWDRFIPFLSGFVSAEAHFGATPQGSPLFVINVRADDGPLLLALRDASDVGYIRAVPPYRTSRPAVSWRIGRLRELRLLVSLLDACPPRGRAGRVYRAWRELVLLEQRTGAERRLLAAEVHRQRQYTPGFESLGPRTTGERRQRRCIEALQRWAADGHGSGTCGDYEAWRQRVGRSAPARNTVARVFGSWRDALAAAGIDTSGALPAAHVAALRAGSLPGRERKRTDGRKRVVDAVLRCSAELGRQPRAAEFLRWRARHAPDTPSQMMIYRLFPGGFREVLAMAAVAEWRRRVESAR